MSTAASRELLAVPLEGQDGLLGDHARAEAESARTREEAKASMYTGVVAREQPILGLSRHDWS